MGISEDEYNRRWDAILKQFGGSMSCPSGWLENELSFSCVTPPILVPIANKIDAEQREVVIKRAEKKFSGK